MNELDEKTDRLVRLAEAQDVGGILIASQPGFAWLTGGGSNRVDGSRENGSGSLFVRSDGRRFVIANGIEMPRLVGEELAGSDWTPLEYPWAHDHAHPDVIVRTAAAQSATNSQVGADAPLAGALLLDRVIASARAPLTPPEVDRYRTLGAEAGAALGAVARQLQPGLTEHEIARRISDAAVALGGRAIVVLVAADERMARYRHPVPTATPWQRTVLLVTCIERRGLVVALSRIVAAGAPDNALTASTAACTQVFAALLNATKPGARGRELFVAAQHAYEAAGCPGEELRHHQGGAIGYRSREWLAHPASEEEVRAPQAFAWNPSITGTKVEETALVFDGSIEIVTASPDWPSALMDVQGRKMKAPGILMLDV